MRKISTAEFISKSVMSFYNDKMVYTAQDADFIEPSSHTQIEFLYLKEGRILYSVNGQKFTANEGDLVVINTNELHSLEIDTSKSFHRINIHFSPDLIPELKSLDVMRIFTFAASYNHLIPKHVVGQTSISSILSAMTSLASETSKYTEYKMIIRLQELILETYNGVDILLTKYPHLINMPHQTNPYIIKAIEYIQNNLDKPLTVHGVANQLALSKQYFQSLFKKDVGVSPLKYIQKQKMQYALTAIRSGTPPTAVAITLGYDYYSTFYHQFKQEFGFIPTKI